MKNVNSIEERLRQLLAEELDRRLKEASTRLPRLCTHNHQQPLDVRRLVHGETNDYHNRIARDDGSSVGQTLGLCMYGASSPEEWPGNICEDPIDAQRCPLFTPILSKDIIWKAFEHEVRDIEWLRKSMPEAYALFWVLEGSDIPRLSWWRRFLFRIHVIRIERITKIEKIERLLPLFREDTLESFVTKVL